MSCAPIFPEHSHAKKAVAKADAGADVSDTEIDTHSDSVSSMEIHSWIGVALVLGFIFMLLVDQIGSMGHSHFAPGKIQCSGPSHPSNVSTSSLSNNVTLLLLQ